MYKNMNYILTMVIATVISLTTWAGQVEYPHDFSALSDSILDHRHRDGVELTVRMAQSAYPVQISILGNAICVRSNYNQVLPVYTEEGAFYAAFRLNKGTNWLSGLPRGTYYVNNRKIVIP